MIYAIKELEECVDTFFHNRHGVGWGYRINPFKPSKPNCSNCSKKEYLYYLKRRELYRKAQHERREELRSYIKAIRLIRLVNSKGE